MLSKIQNFVKNSKFRQKFKILSKIQNFVKNSKCYQKFCQKLKILPKIDASSTRLLRKMCRKNIAQFQKLF